MKDRSVGGDVLDGRPSNHLGTHGMMARSSKGVIRAVVSRAAICVADSPRSLKGTPCSRGCFLPPRRRLTRSRDYDTPKDRPHSRANVKWPPLLSRASPRFVPLSAATSPARPTWVSWRAGLCLPVISLTLMNSPTGVCATSRCGESGRTARRAPRTVRVPSRRCSGLGWARSRHVRRPPYPLYLRRSSGITCRRPRWPSSARCSLGI
jgi:hypothetical protein